MSRRDGAQENLATDSACAEKRQTESLGSEV